VRLDTALAAEPLRADADATQLQQVLMNLCTNAWHALPQGRGRIEVGLARLDADAALALGAAQRPECDSAHLWVADDGVGMDAATRERLFDPFFTTKPVGQGTGLGLSVVHGIVRGHRGQLVVHSTPGQGSSFHVLLPLVQPENLPADEVVAPEAVPGSGRGRHVLVVDDDEVVAITTQALLERAGWLVTLCSTAPQALQRLQQPADLLGPFDIVVSDHNMPQMSGMEFAAVLAREHPALPVIISSGYITDEMRRQATLHGVRALLQKEHTLERLPELMQQVLAGSTQARS
jgi:CheY-like chemotaxis protein